MKTKITELFDIKYPIIQGALQYLSMTDLAVAVSESGGLGTIPAMSFRQPEELRSAIREIKERTSKPFAVNISMLPEVVIDSLTKSFIEVVIKEQVPIVETSGRSPQGLVPIFKDHGLICTHKVSTLKHAKKAQELGVDAVTIVGYECGGHPGIHDVTSSIFFAKAVSELTIPIIGAGGICDGKSFYSAMSLGVDGVMLGTRFLASTEVKTSPEFRETLLKIQEHQTVLTLQSLNNAMRVYHNPLAEKILQLEADGATLAELMPYISGIKSFKAMESGQIDEAQIVVGQAIGRINEILPASAIINELMTGFQTSHQQMNVLAT